MDCTHYGFFAAHGNSKRQTERNVDARARGHRLATLVVVTVALIPWVDSLAGDAVGRIEGSFDVTSTGAATYSIPIRVPAGAAGIVPEIALIYSSQRAEGLAGFGWSLSGMSKISRCRSTVAVDGRFRGVEFDAEDRLCLDGRPLILAGGSEYRTEIHRFERVTAFGSAGAASPAYFRVELPSGRVLVYGNDEGGSDATMHVVGTNEVRSWMLKKVIDPYDNRIVYSYDSDPVSGASVPNSIAWSSNPSLGTESRYALTFEYEDRRSGCDGALCRDVRSGYVHGTPWSRGRRLSRISYRYDGDIVHAWTLTYAAATTTGRSVLTSVTQCGFLSDETTCFPSTTFQAHDSASGWANVDSPYFPSVSAIAWDTAQVADFDGNGSDDLYWVDPVTNQLQLFYREPSGYLVGQLLQIPAPGAAAFTTLDYDGDGDADVLSYDAESWVLNTSVGSAPDFFATNLQFAGGSPHVIDLNGDGKDDVIYQCAHNDRSLCARLSTFPDGVFSTEYASGLPQLADATRTHWFSFVHYMRKARRRPIDFDGDGLHDLLIPTAMASGASLNATWQAHLSTGIDMEPTAMGSFTGMLVATADVNGDGLSDVIYSNGTWRVRLSTGNGFTDEDDTGIPVSYNVVPMIVDYESDGRDDLLLPVGNQWRVFTSDGLSYENSRSMDSGVPDPAQAPWVMPADIRGHGETDLYVARADTRKWTYDFHLASGDRDLLHTAQDGLGNEVTVYYDSINDVATDNGTGSASATRRSYRLPRRFLSLFRGNDGIGGIYTRRYAYRGARIDLGGRGFLGFANIDFEDSRGEAGTTTYDQEFPLVGTVIAVETWQTAARQNRRAESFSIYGVEEWTAATADPADKFYFVHPVERRDTEYDQSGMPLRNTVTRRSNFDRAHGLPRTTTTEVGSPHAAGIHRSTRSVAFDDGGLVAGYCLGLPASIVILNTGPDGDTGTRQVEVLNNATRCNVSTRTVDPSGVRPLVSTTSYDGYGNVVQSRTSDAAASGPPRETRYGYDPDGYRLISEQYLVRQSAAACGNAISSTWDTQRQTWNYALGLLATRTGIDGLTTKWEYDDFGRLVQTRSLDDETYVDVEYRPCSGSCPANGRYEVLTTGSDGQRKMAVHDEYGRRIARSFTLFDGLESRTEVVFDPLGGIDRHTKPFIAGDPKFWVDYSYDAIGRIVSIDRPVSEQEPSGSMTLFDYAGLDVMETNPKSQTTTRRYSPTRRLTRISDAANGVTEYTYSPFGQLESMTDPGGHARSFRYDGMGGLIAADDPDSGSWLFEFNAFGELVSRSDDVPAPNTARTLFSYDLRGRVVSRRDQVGDVDVARTDWVYGALGSGRGRLVRVSGPELGFRETHVYNDLGLLSRTTTTIDGESYSTDWSYDNQRRLDTATYPASLNGNRPTFQYAYNANGYLASVHDTSGGLDRPIYTVAAGRDALARVTEATFGFGAGAYPEQNAFDAASLLPTFTTAGVDGMYQRRRYDWDSLGNMVFRQALDLPGTPSEWIVYDDLNRLTRTTTTDSSGEQTIVTATYDPTGNILSKSDVGEQYDYVGDSGPHAVDTITGGPVGQLSFEYDRNGNTVSIGDEEITWTPFNKPRSITAGGRSTTFSYGPDRRRIRKDSGNTSVVYVGPHFEIEANGQETTYRARVFVGDRLIYVQKESTAPQSSRGFFVHVDHQNSVETLVQSHGAATDEAQRLAFGAFGKRRNTDWSPDPSGERASDAHVTELGYTGHEHLDSPQFIHMNGRVQDPAIARMLSPDPLFGRLGDPQSHNPYAYAKNNPLTFIDPTGHDPRYRLTGRAWTVTYYPNGSSSGESRSGREEWAPFWAWDVQGGRFCGGCRQQYANEDWLSGQVSDPGQTGSPRPTDLTRENETDDSQPPAAADVLNSDWVDLEFRNATSLSFLFAFGVGVQGAFELDMDWSTGHGTLSLTSEVVVAGLGASIGLEPSLEGSLAVGPTAGSPFPVKGTLCTTGACGNITLFDERLAKLTARGGLIVGQAAAFSVQLPTVGIPVVLYPTIVPLRGIPIF